MFRAPMLLLLATAACTDASKDPVDPPLIDSALEDGEFVISTVVDNQCPAERSQAVIPADDEEGHWALSRLTPTETPWTAEQFSYALVANIPTAEGATSSCRYLGHRVQAFVAPSDGPPATPENLAIGAVEADFGPDNARSYTLVLDSPLVINDGESLWIMIEMTFDEDGDRVCTAACTGGTRADNYWSNSVEAPYPWSPLADFGINYDYLMWAEGQP